MFWISSVTSQRRKRSIAKPRPQCLYIPTARSSASDNTGSLRREDVLFFVSDKTSENEQFIVIISYCVGHANCSDQRSANPIKRLGLYYIFGVFIGINESTHYTHCTQSPALSCTELCFSHVTEIFLDSFEIKLSLCKT